MSAYTSTLPLQPIAGHNSSQKRPHLTHLISMFWHVHCTCTLTIFIVHYSNKLKEHFDIMIFIERYSLKRCQGCVILIASKVNCFLNVTDLSEVQLCMSSNSWTWECPHTKDGANHVLKKSLSSVFCRPCHMLKLALWDFMAGNTVHVYVRFLNLHQVLSNITDNQQNTNIKNLSVDIKKKIWCCLP